VRIRPSPSSEVKNVSRSAAMRTSRCAHRERAGGGARSGIFSRAMALGDDHGAHHAMTAGWRDTWPETV
jgi:hypothetical protein